MGAPLSLSLTLIAVCSLPGWAQGASLDPVADESRMVNTDNDWGNVNCGLHTRRIGIVVDNATSFQFTTQRKGEAEYKDNTDCRVLYKPGEKCHKIQFSCSQVAVKAKWNKPSKHYHNSTKPSSSRFCFGDYMRVRSHGKMSRSCRGSKPTVTSTGALAVFFHANPRTVSQGAVCTVECVEDTSAWKGEIVSPVPMPSNFSEMVNITVEDGYGIRVAYKKFSVPCASAKVEILHGDDGSQVNTGRDCGDLIPGENTFTVLANSTTVDIEATLTPPTTEWDIRWEAIKAPGAGMRSLDLMDLSLAELELAVDDMDVEED